MAKADPRDAADEMVDQALDRGRFAAGEAEQGDRMTAADEKRRAGLYVEIGRELARLPAADERIDPFLHREIARPDIGRNAPAARRRRTMPNANVGKHAE